MTVAVLVALPPTDAAAVAATTAAAAVAMALPIISHRLYCPVRQIHCCHMQIPYEYSRKMCSICCQSQERPTCPNHRRHHFSSAAAAPAVGPTFRCHLILSMCRSVSGIERERERDRRLEYRFIIHRSSPILPVHLCCPPASQYRRRRFADSSIDSNHQISLNPIC